MRKYKINCPYCGASAICRPANVVHGHAVRQKGSYLYLCSNWPACDAYVSAHRKDRRPMGTLADKKLRRKRIQAHRALEEFRQERRMEKWGVYLWLQGELQMDPDKTHVGMFTEEMCDRVIALCHKSLQSERSFAA